MSAALLSGLGARVRALRTARGWSQRELARRAGVSPRFLVQVEQGAGNLSLSRLAQLSEALEVSPVSLLRGLGPVRDALDRVASAAAELPEAERRRLLLELGGEERVKLALVGIRGAGKTTLGRALSERLGWPFLALDRMVQARAGMSLAAIFEYGGAERYRALSRALLEELLADGEAAVLEVGGSLVSDAPAWELLLRRARVAWLRAGPAELLRRVRAQGDLRPMAGWEDPRGALEAIIAERSPGYAKADFVLDTESVDVAGGVEALIGWLTRGA